jgi:hypothetical protein
MFYVLSMHRGVDSLRAVSKANLSAFFKLKCSRAELRRSEEELRNKEYPVWICVLQHLNR